MSKIIKESLNTSFTDSLKIEFKNLPDVVNYLNIGLYGNKAISKGLSIRIDNIIVELDKINELINKNKK